MLALVAALMLQAATPPPLARPEDFRRGPRASDVARHYPERAKALRIEGRATLVCTVIEDGSLTGCRVSSEHPVGWGFGEAALKMSAEFRVRAKPKDGRPAAGGRIVIPLKFSLG